MEYYKTPIIDLVTGGSPATVAAGGSLTQTVTFSDGELSSEKILVKVKCALSSDTAQNHVSFRYRNDIYMELNILFHADQDNDLPETRQVVVFFPNNQYEKKRDKPLEYEIAINRYFIKSIVCTLYNKSQSSIVVSKATVRRQTTEAEDYAEHTGINNNTLNSVSTYNDGCKLYYDNQTNPTVLKFVDDGSGGLAAIDVNPGQPNYKRISFTKNNTDI